VLHEFLGETGKIVIRVEQRNARQPAAGAKSSEMLRQPIKAMTKRPAQIRDGRPHHEAGIVKAHMCLRLRQQTTIEVDKRLNHTFVWPSNSTSLDRILRRS